MRSFAIVPAAGLSQRMGRPKLLLPWQGKTVIDHLLRAWKASPVERTVIVIRPDDRELADVCRRHDVDLVVPPAAPEEMKVSIRLGLEHIAAACQPDVDDVWLLAPADMPRLSARTIRRIIDEHDPARPAILVPYVGAERGHPVLFPWPLSTEVARLGDDEGVNALLDRHEVRKVTVDDDAVLEDLDTPAEYERLQRGEH